jgi:hypothetical protein
MNARGGRAGWLWPAVAAALVAACGGPETPPAVQSQAPAGPGVAEAPATPSSAPAGQTHPGGAGLQEMLAPVHVRRSSGYWESLQALNGRPDAQC